MGRMSNHPTRDAVAALLTKGLNKSEIARTLGVARSTVSRWIDKISIAEDHADKTPTEISEFIQMLAPISIANNYHSANLAIKPNNEFTVVIGDTHFGQECQRTINIFYDVIRDLKPGNIILNGDTLDLLAVSKYPKDVRYDVSLLDERIAYHKFLATVRDIVGTEVKIYETNANHSGNGVEGRWWRYLSERLGAVAALPEVFETLSYEKVFIPAWANVELTDCVELLGGGLQVLHGDVVRKQGGMSARGMMDKWFTSLIMNHTHRMGMTAQRIPALGSRLEAQLFAYENGCACKLDPSYATATNWQNGFSIVSASDYTFAVEQVLVVDGFATSTTTGKSYKA